MKFSFSSSPSLNIIMPFAWLKHSRRRLLGGGCCCCYIWAMAGTTSLLSMHVKWASSWKHENDVSATDFIDFEGCRRPQIRRWSEKKICFSLRFTAGSVDGVCRVFRTIESVEHISKLSNRLDEVCGLWKFNFSMKKEIESSEKLYTSDDGRARGRMMWVFF